MRYLLFALLLIPPVFAGAQTRVYVTQDQPQQIRQFRGGVDALNYFRLPIQGGHSIPAGDSLWFVRVNPADGNVYMWDGLTWKCVSCGSGSGADSSVFATNYRLDTTRSGLDARVSTKLDISDTTGKWLALGWLSSLVKYSDTSGMLQPYLRSVVFADSLNAIHGAINDTAQAIRSDMPDVSGLVPQSRTITINGSTQDLSANRSWTIPVPDTSSLRADIDANSDSILVHRADIDGKEPIITPGTTSQYWRGDKTWQPFPFIPDSTDYWTRYDADTSLQNIRDEISNLPAPPVTSVNGQTGNVNLRFVDTSYVSNDTFYSRINGDLYVVTVLSGGGGLDTSAVSAIVADSLSGVIRQGGNSFGAAVEIGSNEDQNVNIKSNNVTRIQVRSNGSIIINNSIFVGATGNTSIGKTNNSGDKLEVVGYGTFTNGGISADGSSTTTGFVGRFRNSSGTVVAQFNNNNTVQFNSLSGTGTGVVIGTDAGELTIERPPASGTYILKSVDGVIQWVAE